MAIIRRKFKALTLGELPLECLEKAGLKLAAGSVHFSIAAQKHALSHHGDDFYLCEPFLAETVASPTYAGQGPDHKGKGFELVLHTRRRDLIVLVAIHLKPTKAGTYIVKSAYPINSNTLKRRLRKGFLVKV
jgi:hypothetical protein